RAVGIAYIELRTPIDRQQILLPHGEPLQHQPLTFLRQIHRRQRMNIFRLQRIGIRHTAEQTCAQKQTRDERSAQMRKTRDHLKAEDALIRTFCSINAAIARGVAHSSRSNSAGESSTPNRSDNASISSIVLNESSRCRSYSRKSGCSTIP